MVKLLFQLLISVVLLGLLAGMTVRSRNPVQKPQPAATAVPDAEQETVSTASSQSAQPMPLEQDAGSVAADTRLPTEQLAAELEGRRDFERQFDAMPPAQLITELRSNDYQRKAAAARAVARKPSAELLTALMNEISTCEDLSTRKEMLKALGTTDMTVAPALLAERLGVRKDGDVQRSIREAMVKSADASVVRALVARIEGSSDDNYLERQVAQVISDIRNPTAVDALILGLQSTNYTAFVGCAAALGGIGDVRGVQALAGAAGVDSQHDEVISEALSRVAPASALSTLVALSRQAVPPPVSLGIAKALAKYNDPAARSALEAMAQRTGDEAILNLLNQK